MTDKEYKIVKIMWAAPEKMSEQLNAAIWAHYRVVSQSQDNHCITYTLEKNRGEL